MKYLLVTLVTFLTTAIPSLSLAHPVSFRNSLGIMGYHSPTLTHNQINYSFRHWYALGVHHFTRPDLKDNKTATFASANFLLKRWNGDSYQANVYGALGAGESHFTEHDNPESIGFGLFQFDIEDREYYFLIKHMEIASKDVKELKQTTIRLGLAPYVDNFDGLHSWLILDYQFGHLLETETIEDLTPMLRIFYNNLLFELGQSLKGMTKFNYIVHY